MMAHEIYMQAFYLFKNTIRNRHTLTNLDTSNVEDMKILLDDKLCQTKD